MSTCPGLSAARPPFAHLDDTKLSRYTIADPYLRFWLRFIGPNLPLIERRRGDLAVRRVMDGWNTYRGHAIEPIVRACIERMLPEERFGDANFLGAFWTRTNNPEVDLVGSDDDRRPTSAEFVGSIKWRDKSALLTRGRHAAGGCDHTSSARKRGYPAGGSLTERLLPQRQARRRARRRGPDRGLVVRSAPLGTIRSGRTLAERYITCGGLPLTYALYLAHVA